MKGASVHRSQPFMTKPPAGASLLFGALADSGRIKERKNGSYHMVLDGVDEIDWFTDRPDRVEGTWKPQKLLRKWDKYFANSEPNAQATVEVGEQRELFTFEMFKPKIKNNRLKFKIKPISSSGKDKMISASKKAMRNISLFIDDALLSGNQSIPQGQTWNGNVTGNVIGDVTGNVVGNVTGNVYGEVTNPANNESPGNTTRTITITPEDINGWKEVGKQYIITPKKNDKNNYCTMEEWDPATDKLHYIPEPLILVARKYIMEPMYPYPPYFALDGNECIPPVRTK